MESFVICTRSIKKGKFRAEPGPTRYLLVPEGDRPAPVHEVKKADVWVKKLIKASVWGKDSREPTRDRGDILVFIHGYNNDQKTVMRRHNRLVTDMSVAGFKGVVLSFDWPSDDKALNYLEDRHDAKQTAMQLVTDGISLLSREQTPDCAINIHLLAHSTGAYVIREAFDDADDTRLPNNAWTVSQIAFIGGDISSGSLSEGNSSSEAIFRHCVRLTNYSNLRDSVLKLSNTKRLGTSPRVGRIGLPADAPSIAVNLNCSKYFKLLSTDKAVRKADQQEEIGSVDHSWHIGNKVFAQDLLEVLKGDLDRQVIPTRKKGADGLLELVRPEE
jgi:hypothetical protein